MRRGGRAVSQNERWQAVVMTKRHRNSERAVIAGGGVVRVVRIVRIVRIVGIVAVLAVAAWAPTIAPGTAASGAAGPTFRRVTTGREVTAVASLPGGTIRFAERGGAIVDVRPDGSRRRVVARLSVNVVGQRGVLGLDTDRMGNTAITSVRKDGTMIVTILPAKGTAEDPAKTTAKTTAKRTTKETAKAAAKDTAKRTTKETTKSTATDTARVVYEGRKTKDAANGGHILFEPDGKGIVLGLGDFLEGRKRGRFVRIDTATSTTKELSVGWNNPFAFDWRPGPGSNAAIIVADNSPNDGPEEVAELNGRRFGPLPKESTPSALAMTSSAPLEGVVCSYVSHELARYRFTPPTTPTGVGMVTKKETLATDCSVAVRLLPDRRLVYATQTHLMISDRPLP